MLMDWGAGGKVESWEMGESYLFLKMGGSRRDKTPCLTMRLSPSVLAAAKP
jgi:hypothetical protein